MKISVKKSLIWVAVAIIAVVIVMQPGNKTEKFVYDIETISQTCNFDVFEGQDVRSVEDSIIITMPIQTPTPCYDVTGTVNFFGSDIVVNLDTKAKDGFCAECIGTVVAKVTLSNLDKGTYDVQLNTPDKHLVFKEVKVQ